MKLKEIIQPISLAPSKRSIGWGPERPTYTMENPADHATFNSITDNAAVGDERDFVRIVEVVKEGEEKKEYVSDLEIESGKDYEVFIYFHNDASMTLNDEAHNFVGVSRDTRVSSTFPSKMSAGDVGKVFGRITSSTAEPEAVWDEAYVRAKESMTLHYVSGSAKIYNRWQANGSVLSQNLFSDKGTFIGMNSLNGTVPGCDVYSGQVVYTIRTVADGDPIPDDVEYVYFM